MWIGRRAKGIEQAKISKQSSVLESKHTRKGIEERKVDAEYVNNVFQKKIQIFWIFLSFFRIYCLR